MKTIILFRHGKSDWGADHAADRDRPLAARGRKAAATMGALLARLGQVPDRALTSPALRARETFRLAAEAGGWTCPIEIVPGLYDGSTVDVLERVRAEADSTSSLLLAGHEPTWSQLASELVGGGAVRFPTAALLRVDVDVETWSAVDAGRGVLVWFLLPRLVQAAGLELGAS
ncbi:MAG: histidine phosphatase family protein [Acidobacteriota bacterium]|nr:histidine phosphatase family protein [Acidobacteriota bacterium]